MDSPRVICVLSLLVGIPGCASLSQQSTESILDMRPAIDGLPQRVTTPRATEPVNPDAAMRTPLTTSAPGAQAIALALPVTEADTDHMVAHFIDVGQGDATLLEFSCGAVLIDTGGETTDDLIGRDRLIAYLNEFFGRRSDLDFTLDLVVLSHPHRDHTDGVSELLSAQPPITILNVLDNGTTQRGSGISGQKALQRRADDSGAGYLGLSESQIINVSGATNAIIDPIDCSADGGVDPVIAALWGRVDLDTGWANDANNDSVVLRIEFGDASFLFTGDLEEQGIDAMLESYIDDQSAFDVDVIKVGHHGSRNGITTELVEAVTPRVAVIQAGDSRLSQATFSAFSFGHPNRDTIEKLLAPNGGIQTARPAITVPVGIKGRNPFTGDPPEFAAMTIDRAIYANGWDGNVAVIADQDGDIEIETGF